MSVRLAEPGEQTLTKSLLLIEGLAPSDTIEYPKIVSAQRHAVQPHRRAVFREILEDTVREEVRPDRFVGKRTPTTVSRVFFEERKSSGTLNQRVGHLLIGVIREDFLEQQPHEIHFYGIGLVVHHHLCRR